MCSKNFADTPQMTGGLTLLRCEHQVVRGFTALPRGESVLKMSDPIIRRFPPRVRALKRYFIYDAGCKARVSAEKRFPHRLKNWTYLVDAFHYSNHRECSEGFNSKIYPDLHGVNTQTCEQFNSGLRKLSTILAHMKFSNYIKLLEIYIATKNLKVKSSSN